MSALLHNAMHNATVMFYVGFYGVVWGSSLLARLVARVLRRRTDRKVAEARAATRARLELAVGEYNGKRMMSVLFYDPEAEAERERERQAWWDSLGPGGQAEHLAWEEAETAKWLAWANAAVEERS